MIKFLDAEKLEMILPRISEVDRWLEILTFNMELGDITTRERVAMFLAQTSHESAGYTRFKENLNYSADGLLRTFGKYFTPELAQKYARKPEMIANRVYANRMGNGPESSGDGWKFSGRGAIQITGKNNYSALAKFLEMDLDQCVHYLTLPEGAVHSAVWYWSVNGLNRLSDSRDIVRVTRVINGGRIGLEERTEDYKRIFNILRS